MSYNVSSTITLSSTLTITRERAAALLRDHKDVLPEVHFLDKSLVSMSDLRCPVGHKATGSFCSECGLAVPDEEILPLRQFWWYGLGSGYMGNLAIAASYTKGEAEIVLVWEGGDEIEAIRVKDGVVTKHEVKYVVGDPIRVLHPEHNGDGDGQ